MAYKCPHCDEEIDCLKYCEDATIYGSYDIETEDYEQEETEAEGGVNFRCPECDENIGSTDDLINTEEERENRRRRENTTPRDRIRPIPVRCESTLALDLDLSNNTEEGRELPIPEAIKQEWRGEYSGYHNSHDKQKQLYILVCSKCGSKNETLDNETVECYNCGKELNQANAKKVIAIEKQTP